MDKKAILTNNSELGEYVEAIKPKTTNSNISKDTFEDNDKKGIFNVKALRNPKAPIYVVDDKLDALSVIKVGGEAIGLGNTKAQSFVNLVTVNKPCVPLFLAIKNNNITQGELLHRLKDNDIECYAVDICDKYKSANDYFTKDKCGFTAKINDVCNSYKKQESSKYQELILSPDSPQARTKGVSTGFLSLDKNIDNLQPLLYTIKGEENIGKSSFCLQIAVNIAKTKKPVFIVSTQMTKDEIKQRCSTIITAMNKNEKIPLSRRDVFDFILVDEMSTRKEDIGLEIREYMDEIKWCCGQTPVVIVDCFQQIADYFIGYNHDERVLSAQKYFMCLNTEYKTPVIVVSSSNQEGYKALDSYSIEYGSKVVLIIAKSDDADKNKDICVKVLKHKFKHGNTTCKLFFDAKTGHFEENQSLRKFK